MTEFEYQRAWLAMYILGTYHALRREGADHDTAMQWAASGRAEDLEPMMRAAAHDPPHEWGYAAYRAGFTRVRWFEDEHPSITSTGPELEGMLRIWRKVYEGSG